MFYGTYIFIDGLTVHDTMWPGFMIRQSAEGITIANSTAYDAGMGVWVAEGAGMNHRIIHNVFKDNRTFGVDVDTVNNMPDKETIIANNIISGHKSHGIEIMGNYYVIEGNVVSGNVGVCRAKPAFIFLRRMQMPKPAVFVDLFTLNYFKGTFGPSKTQLSARDFR